MRYGDRLGLGVISKRWKSAECAGLTYFGVA
jgi:hypothetical protein